MASSTCNRVFAFALAATLLGGCVSIPDKTVGNKSGQNASSSGEQTTENSLTKAQRQAFKAGATAITHGNADKAVRIFKELIKAKPELAAAHANLGTALMMRGDNALAASAFERATALDPSLSGAYVHLGIVRRRNGEFAKAKRAYKAALAQNPDNRYAHLNLGILYDVYLRKPRKALSHYERYQKLSKSSDKDVTKWIKDLKRRL